MYPLAVRSATSESLVVADPEIAEVLDRSTGEFLSAWDAVGEDYERALQL